MPIRITPLEVVDNLTTALGIASQRSAVTLAPACVAVLARAFGLVHRRMIEPETLRRASPNTWETGCRARQVGRPGRRSQLQPGAGYSVAAAGTSRRLSMPAK